MLSAEPKAEVDNTYMYQDYSGYHKYRILKEINIQFDIALGNYALRAQPTR